MAFLLQKNIQNRSRPCLHKWCRIIMRFASTVLHKFCCFPAVKTWTGIKQLISKECRLYISLLCRCVCIYACRYIRMSACHHICVSACLHICMHIKYSMCICAYQDIHGIPIVDNRGVVALHTHTANMTYLLWSWSWLWFWLWVSLIMIVNMIFQSKWALYTSLHNHNPNTTTAYGQHLRPRPQGHLRTHMHKLIHMHTYTQRTFTRTQPHTCTRVVHMYQQKSFSWWETRLNCFVSMSLMLSGT